ncbi:hypothetical protein BCV69DRAFT_313031 [Microstroma glucosiphilum]|uniref:Uncharacterized protein n=1 Tax=Pseudomicrostroma glucosiphilum TaxID=1684307 RepID=A0A316U6K5_9BASI|nr:hypothetical protein BCV69DRAFT_313031 [Pseudomicrostroma glucosiphilum]PWN20448.1 hypothetical protein BCV69DRAFT_313031 [Pseudomicrostroma glucosiphilum]
MAAPVDKTRTELGRRFPSPSRVPRSVTGFSPGGATPTGYSYLNRAPALVTSTRRGPVRSVTESPPAPATSDMPKTTRLPASCNESQLSESSSSPPRRPAMRAFPRSNTTPNLHSTHVASSAGRIQAPLAAHSLADLPRDPRTWLPDEVSIYLFHVFVNVPVPVMETLAHFVASAHLTGKAFLRLRERDLEKKGMNTRWRRLLCEASRRLRRDALRRRIWSGREDEWSGSDEGGSDRPRDTESAREGSQLANGEKRVMTITLKRIQNRKYVKDVIQGLEPAASDENQPRVPGLRPRRKETASWAHADTEGYTSSRDAVSPSFGEGYVRGRVTSLTYQKDSGSWTTRQRQDKDGFSQSSSVDSIIGLRNDSPGGPSESADESKCTVSVPSQGADWSEAPVLLVAASEEDRTDIAGETEDVSPWSPLEPGLIDAILESDMSRSQESDIFSMSRDYNMSSASTLAGDIDYDPVKRVRASTSQSEDDFWRGNGVEDDGRREMESDREAKEEETNVVTGEEKFDEDRYQDSPEDEPENESAPQLARDSFRLSKPPDFHARTFSRASTRSTRSLFTALETDSVGTIRSDYATAPSDFGSLTYSAPRRKKITSVTTLFGLGIAEAELEGQEVTHGELSGIEESLPIKSAELSSSDPQNAGSDGEEEEGQFDDPAEETEPTSALNLTEHSTCTNSDSRIPTSNQRDAQPFATSPNSGEGDPSPSSDGDGPSSWQTLLRSTIDQLQYVRGCMGLRALPAYAVALGMGAVVVLGSAALNGVVGRKGVRG